jgi:N-acetyltransferase 10
VCIVPQAYCSSAVDHHVVRDLWGPLAHAYFSQRLPVSLSVGQATILVALGLQARDLDSLEAAMQLPANQILALFNKVQAHLPPSHYRKN